MIRFDRDVGLYYHLFMQSLPIVIACQIVSFFASGVYRVGLTDGSLTMVADTDAFELANPPAFIPPDDEISNPYDIVALDGVLYVTDGNRSVIYAIDPAAAEGSRIRYLADMSVGHPVLTGIAAGPDGALYVTNLTAAPFPSGGAASRWASPSSTFRVSCAACRRWSATDLLC